MGDDKFDKLQKDAVDRYPEILKWRDRIYELTDEEIRQYIKT